MLGCMAVLPVVQFRTDVRQYDGTSESILRTEEKFQENWSSKHKAAMLVVEAESFDGALDKSAEMLPEVKAALNENPYVSLSQVWPAAPRRLENIEACNRYWTKGRQAELRAMVTAAATPIGFRANAFASFFEMLHLNLTEVQAFERNELLLQLKKRFAFATDTGYRLVNFFPDKESLVAAVVDKSQAWPGSFVVSQEKYARDLSRSILSEALFLSVLIALIVLKPSKR